MKPVDVELQNVTKVFHTAAGQVAFKAVDDLSLQIYDGEFFALLGPSGCGKTTTLRMIAGFEDATQGDILIQGKSVRRTPPYRRPVNTVFQDYALFPHMTVLQNVMFGLKMENVRHKEAVQRANEALELVQLPNVSNRRPRQLSGGQQQRVALARALVKKPTVLLLDEPLGALDLKLRKAMQYELKTMQQQLGITFIYVTHDQEEALTMADRIAVMRDGRIEQLGSPTEIYDYPNTRYVADFIGETNFIPAKFLENKGEYGRVLIGQHTEIDSFLGEHYPNVGDAVTVAIRPEKIGIFGTEGMIRQNQTVETSATDFANYLANEPDQTVVKGTINQTFYIGTDIRYHVDVGSDVELICRSQNIGTRHDRFFEPGETVHVFWENNNSRILTE